MSAEQRISYSRVRLEEYTPVDDDMHIIPLEGEGFHKNERRCTSVFVFFIRLKELIFQEVDFELEDLCI
jgi:hypothetical protein